MWQTNCYKFMIRHISNCDPNSIDCILKVSFWHCLCPLQKKEILGRMRTGRACRCEVQRFKQSVHVQLGSKKALLLDSFHVSLGLHSLFYMCVYINPGWGSMFYNLCVPDDQQYSSSRKFQVWSFLICVKKAAEAPGQGIHWQTRWMK